MLSGCMSGKKNKSCGCGNTGIILNLTCCALTNMMLISILSYIVTVKCKGDIFESANVQGFYQNDYDQIPVMALDSSCFEYCRLYQVYAHLLCTNDSTLDMFFVLSIVTSYYK